MQPARPTLPALGRLAVALVAVGLALGPLAGAPANTGEVVVRGSMASTAKAIKAALDERPKEQRSVSMGTFTCSRSRHANGELLARLLGEELGKLGVTVKDRGAVGIAGSFRLVADKETKRSMVKVTITLEDREGKVGKPMQVDFFEAEVVTLLFPEPSVLPKPGVVPDPKDLEEGKAHVEDTLIRASKSGKYAVEVLVVDSPTEKTQQADYTAVKPRLDDGRAFVDIRQGQAYAVRLINDSDQDAAVALSIDGLNSFRFLEVDGKRVSGPTHVLVRAKSKVAVLGWQTGPKEVSRFLVTERDKGAWVGHASPAGVGRIVAQFHACWSADEGPPKDEPRARAGTRSASGLSTGMGDKVKSPIKTVSKTVGQLRESVPVLYSRRSK
jgi:hypothetical protein